MCGPIKKQAPKASTMPTMQAADELELVTDGLQDNAIGRTALRTAGKGGARTPASATAAAAILPGGGPTPGQAAAVQAPTDGAASDALGLGRKLGSKQPFYNPDGSVQP